MDEPLCAKLEELTLLRIDDSFMLYGDSGDGKTTQIGEVAIHLYKTAKLRTRVCMADEGGYESIKFLERLKTPILDVVPMMGDPWIWIDRVTHGFSWVGGKWVKGIAPDIGLIAFESATSMSDMLLSDMAERAAKGVNIGGSGAISLKVGSGLDTMSVSNNNMAHYGFAQSFVRKAIWDSLKLGVPVLWTAGVRRDEDQQQGKILGPAFAGGALTSQGPRWIKFTFRIEAQPGQLPNQPTKRVLHLEDHYDSIARSSKGVGNVRSPLYGKTILPASIEPASVLEALRLIRQRQSEAPEIVEKMLGMRS